MARASYLEQNSGATFGHKKKVVKLGAAYQLLEADSGKIFMLNSASEFATTLPAIKDAGAGWYCKIVVDAAPSGAAYTVVEKAADDTDVIIVNGINELEVDTNEDGPSSTGCTTITFADGVAIQGDFIDIWCDGENYYVSGQTKADGGITVA
jgi:hypothetical protein